MVARIQRIFAEVSGVNDEPVKTVFMTQRSATKIAELREAGHGLPWLSGIEVQIVPLGTRIIGPNGADCIMAGEGSIVFMPEGSKAIEP